MRVHELPLDFGDTPVKIEPRAWALLSKLPTLELSRVASALGRWAEAAPVQSVRVSSTLDPDDQGWEEVLIELHVDANTEEALALWDDLASAVDTVKSQMPDRERRKLDQSLGIHLVWENDNERG